MFKTEAFNHILHQLKSYPRPKKYVLVSKKLKHSFEILSIHPLCFEFLSIYMHNFMQKQLIFTVIIQFQIHPWNIYSLSLLYVPERISNPPPTELANPATYYSISSINSFQLISLQNQIHICLLNVAGSC